MTVEVLGRLRGIHGGNVFVYKPAFAERLETGSVAPAFRQDSADASRKTFTG